MFNAYFVKIFYKDAIALFCAASLAVSSPNQIKVTAPLELVPQTKITSNTLTNNTLTQCNLDSHRYTASVYMKTKLWRYLRSGINYLEASGKDVNPYYMHPGRKAYGPLALTPVAIKDVKKHCPELSRYGVEEVLLDRGLYEMFAFSYADLLLRHYLKVNYLNMDKKDVFVMLEKAWFLGPGLYKKGHPVIASREIKAKEYLTALPI